MALACVALPIPVNGQNISNSTSGPQNSRFEISEDDLAIDVITTPVFQGKPIDLNLPSYADLKKAHEKFPTLRSCLTNRKSTSLEVSAAFDWDKYNNEEEAIICMTAVAQWAGSPDKLLLTVSQFMGNSKKYNTGGAETGAHLIVRGGFDREKFPRNERGFWMRRFTYLFESYNITRRMSGFSFSFQADGSLYQVQPS